MIDTEYEFGKLCSSIELTNDIHSEDEKKSFIEVVEKMRDLLIDNWHNEDSELCFNDPDFVTLWEEFKVGEVSDDGALWIVEGVEVMMSDLSEGDAEDAFGPSGWRDYFGWW